MNEERKRIVPYNYKDNGRVFNLIKKKAANKMIIYAVPVMVILYILPLGFQNKVFLATLLLAPALFIFPEEYDERILDMYRYSKNKKIYYESGGSNENLETYYEKEKRRKP